MLDRKLKEETEQAIKNFETKKYLKEIIDELSPMQVKKVLAFVSAARASETTGQGMSDAAKKARNSYNIEQRKNNREKTREYARRWREANPDKVRQHQNTYWEKKAAEMASERESKKTLATDQSTQGAQHMNKKNISYFVDGVKGNV